MGYSLPGKGILKMPARSARSRPISASAGGTPLADLNYNKKSEQRQKKRKECRGTRSPQQGRNLVWLASGGKGDGKSSSMLAVAASLASILLILLAAPPAAAAASAPAGAPDPARLIASYNSRNFGNPGRRLVRLELRSGAQVTRSFEVTNLWRQDGAVVRTVFVLSEPPGLRGTNYLLVEDPSAPEGMKVFLHLPAGERRVLTVAPSHFDQGLLGSDFGYRDLRMRLPTRGFRFRTLGRETVLGREAWIVEATPEPASGPQPVSRYYLSASPPLLLGVDHLRPAAAGQPAEVVKRMRVEGVEQVDGAWTETRMVMEGADGHSSVLSLEDFRPGYTPAGAALFEPTALPTLIDVVTALPATVAAGGRR